MGNGADSAVRRCVHFRPPESHGLHLVITMLPHGEIEDIGAGPDSVALNYGSLFMWLDALFCPGFPARTLPHTKWGAHRCQRELDRGI